MKLLTAADSWVSSFAEAHSRWLQPYPIFNQEDIKFVKYCQYYFLQFLNITHPNKAPSYEFAFRHKTKKT